MLCSHCWPVGPSTVRCFATLLHVVKKVCVFIFRGSPLLCRQSRPEVLFFFFLCVAVADSAD